MASVKISMVPYGRLLCKSAPILCHRGRKDAYSEGVPCIRDYLIAIVIKEMCSIDSEMDSGPVE